MAELPSKQNRLLDGWRDRATALVFLAVIAVPLAVSLANGFAPRVTKEFRFPTPAPTWTSKFPEQFEAWFRDRLGLRHDLVSLYGGLSYGVFGVSPTDRVVAGKDGWFFYASSANTPPRNRLFSVHRGLRPLSSAEVTRSLALLAKDRAWLAERGIEHFFLVAPDKHSIYPEMMPTRFRPVSSSTPRSQLHAALTRREAADFVDLHAPLLASKVLGRVYDKTDTHWNELGAAVAGREIIAALQSSFPEVGALEIPKEISWERAPGMGLARIMGLDAWLWEMSPRLKWPTERRSREVDPSVAFAGSVRAEAREGLGRTVVGVTRVDDEKLPRAVVIHDSFGVLLQPLLSEHFSEVVYVLRIADRRKLAAFLDVYRPDVVLDEIVERGLVNLHSQRSFADG